VSLSDETTARLPELVGGLSLAPARTSKVIDSALPNPSSDRWERAFRVFDLPL
jgi:hypothetical protein